MTGKLIRIDELYTPELCRANPEKVYVYGDNMAARGHGGQAVIRDEPNTIGIPTKLLPAMYEDAFFTDQDWNDHGCVQPAIKHSLRQIRMSLETGHDVVIHRNGVGTGLAQLEQRAPMIFKYINDQIAELERLYPAVS